MMIVAKTIILTYSEIAGQLDNIIGSLRDVRDKPEDACRWRADDLDELATDVEHTHASCPDVPIFATLSGQFTDVADRLRDRYIRAFDAREIEAQELEGIRDGLQALNAEHPEFDEFIRESRGDSLAAQHLEPATPDPGSLMIGHSTAEPGGDVTVVHELHPEPVTPPEETDSDGQSDPLDR